MVASDQAEQATSTAQISKNAFQRSQKLLNIRGLTPFEKAQKATTKKTTLNGKSLKLTSEEMKRAQYL